MGDWWAQNGLSDKQASPPAGGDWWSKNGLKESNVIPDDDPADMGTHPGFWATYGHDINPMNSIPALWNSLTTMPDELPHAWNAVAGAPRPPTGPPVEGQAMPGRTQAQRDYNATLPQVRARLAQQAQDEPQLPEMAGHLAAGATNAAALAAVGDLDMPGVRRAAGAAVEEIPGAKRLAGARGRIAKAYRGAKPVAVTETAEIAGNNGTYEARAKLRDLGGKWDGDRQVWTVPKEKLQAAKDAVAKVPEVKVEAGGYRPRGERSPEDLGKLPGEPQPSRGPLKEPKSGVDAKKPASELTTTQRSTSSPAARPNSNPAPVETKAAVPKTKAPPKAEAERPEPITWRSEIHPTLEMNGIAREHPTTGKIVRALENEFVRRGIVTQEQIPHLRRASPAYAETGRPTFADDYARSLQAYLKALDEGRSPKPLKGGWTTGGEIGGGGRSLSPAPRQISGPGKGGGSSARGDAEAIADVLKKIGTTKADAGTMSPLEWKLVFSNAKLKELPHPDVLKAAIDLLQ